MSREHVQSDAFRRVVVVPENGDRGALGQLDHDVTEVEAARQRHQLGVKVQHADAVPRVRVPQLDRVVRGTWKGIRRVRYLDHVCLKESDQQCNTCF